MPCTLWHIIVFAYEVVIVVHVVRTATCMYKNLLSDMEIVKYF